MPPRQESLILTEHSAGGVPPRPETTPTISVAPDVYWTDDPEAENTENHLVGLTLTAEDLHLVGLGKTPEETVICGDRGQMNGAIGNWNTIGIAGSSFKAENITFGNYCNVGSWSTRLIPPKIIKNAAAVLPRRR